MLHVVVGRQQRGDEVTVKLLRDPVDVKSGHTASTALDPPRTFPHFGRNGERLRTVVMVDGRTIPRTDDMRETERCDHRGRTALRATALDAVP